MGLGQDDWEEHTEIVPRVVLARRRRAVLFLALAACAFSVGAATFAISKRQRVAPGTQDGLSAAAQKLAVILHAAFKQTLDRAEGFAGTPVLEAGILTDAATVNDIVKTEYRLKTRPGETLELFQIRDGLVTSLVRVPPEEQPIHLGKPVRLENRKGLAVVACAEVAPYNNTEALAGKLAVAATIDVSKLQLAGHTVEANLIGAGPPIPLVAKRGAGQALTLPVPLDAKWQAGQLALHAVPITSGYHAGWVLPLRYGTLGLGVVLLSTFLVAFRGALKR